MTGPARPAWTKRGQIYVPDGGQPLGRSHAAVPVAQSIDADTLRVYFSSRDSQNRSRPWMLEFDPHGDAPPVVGRAPLLELGAPGTFDDAGVMPGWVVRTADQWWLYYTGWAQAVTVPFRNAIGLAISRDGGRTFTRSSAGPVLDRSRHDPCFVATPCVLVESGRWRMWYLSAIAWEATIKGLRHRYHIKYAESSDGIDWQRDGHICIDFASADEYAISCPCVIRDGSIYRMWYSYRGDRYRIGYAESSDGVSWTRKDTEAGVAAAESGWDSEMICYANVVDHGGRRLMFYNGNDYGRTGLGYAVLDGV